MSNNDYKIELGVKLSDKSLSDIKTQINGIETKLDPIKVNIDKQYITTQINDIKKQIKEFNDNGNSKKNKFSISIDTEKIENSLSEVNSTIKDIKNSIGMLDSSGNMKSLLSSINQINSSLENTSKKFDSIIADLKALSSKDFSINLDFKIGGGSQVARNVAYGNKVRNETLPQLKEQAKAMGDYLKEYYKVSDEYNAAFKLFSSKGFGGNTAKKLEKMTSTFYSDIMPTMLDPNASLSKQIDAYKQYINYLKEAASIKKEVESKMDLTSVTSQFSKTVEQLKKEAVDIQTGANEVNESFEKLKQIFGGNNLNTEELSRQLNSIVTNLDEIRNSLQGLSGINLEGLTTSFDKLSNTLTELMSNVNIVQNTIDNVGNISTGNISQELKDNVDILEEFKQSLRNIGMGEDKIDDVANKIKNLGVQIKTLNQSESFTAGKKGNKNILSVDVSGIDKDGNVVKLTEQYDIATGNLVKSIDNVSTAQQKAGASTERFVKQQKKAVSDLTNTINQLNSDAIDQNASRPIKEQGHLDKLEAKYKEVQAAIIKMANASEDAFLDAKLEVDKLISEYKILKKEFKNAENVASKMKGTDFESGLEIAKHDLNKLKANAKDFPQMIDTIDKLNDAIKGVGNASSLNEFNDQLRVARAELAKVKAETIAANRKEKVGIDVSGVTSSIANIQRISPEINEFKTEIDGAEVSVESLLNDLSKVKTAGDFSVINKKFNSFKKAAESAGITVTETVAKAKTIGDIKFKLSDTGFNGFRQEVARAHMEAEKLEGVYNDLEASLKQLDIAMEGVYSAEKTGDVKQLVAANEAYENALKAVYSQLKLNQQAEKEDYNNKILTQKKATLSSEMEIWLKENSRAANDFGDEIRRLQSSLDGLDDKGVRLVGQQFNNIKKQAEAAGKTGLTVFDKLKSKAKEYMAYLSAAELFMYAEQALRSMFEQVKAIDSAMTELKKVTDETNASYDKFLIDAASRAKEIGTTIDGLVNSTADFARLGYGFEDAQGLAEVANIYAVVGDEVEGVEGATESLISTMAAYKNEMNGVSNTDFAMGIIDKYNEIGNKFAITSGGIGEALERSASSLNAANNSMDESIALITAANTVVQDPDRVGNAFKTISMRIRGAKTE